MATQILAVDDSATMRKILEITFAGTEFNVVTVDSAGAALQQLRGGGFGLVISDITLDPSGYELCKQLKQAAPSTPVLLLSSRQNPYDNGAGSAAGADDHIDKPFDTQQLIDRVQKLLGAGAGAGAAPAPAAAAAGQNPRAKTLIYGGPAAPAPAAAAPAPAPAAAPARGMGFGAGSPMAKPAAQAAPAARPQAPAPAAAAPKPAAAPAAAAIGAAVNGQLAAKVAELGLTPAQADAVVALSREVVERVVWEVVPVLAETLIKEEIARLTK